MKKYLTPGVAAFIIAILIVGYLLYYRYKKSANKQSSYTKYNDKNFPGLVKYATAPRDTGNPIADIQIQRAVQANPGMQIES